jgi:bifunctional DNA-binding transcriptional regulator/antitoxin component of YhaV-PrlF toxin-antitoxin module
MPAYQLTFPHEYRHRDSIVEGDDLTLTVQGEWVLFADSNGPCAVIPAHFGVIITRIADRPPLDEASADHLFKLING